VILDIPLLTESNIKDYAYIQSIIVISVDPELQISRVCERDGISRTQTQKIIANQISQGERLKLADYVIYNDAGHESLERQVEVIHELILSQLYDI
jgi:dephospho-CoA kinase